MYGTCSVCKKPVQMIYLDPVKRNELVIGPHDAPWDGVGLVESCKGVSLPRKSDTRTYDILELHISAK